MGCSNKDHMNKILMFVFAACVALSAQTTITSVAPRNVGQQTAPITIIITGTGFRSNARVTFGGVALSRTIVSKTKILANVPGLFLNKVGFFAVKVSTSNAVQLQVCAIPVITTTVMQMQPGVPINPEVEGQIQAVGKCLSNP